MINVNDLSTSIIRKNGPSMKNTRYNIIFILYFFKSIFKDYLVFTLILDSEWRESVRKKQKSSNFYSKPTNEKNRFYFLGV